MEEANDEIFGLVFKSCFPLSFSEQKWKLIRNRLYLILKTRFGNDPLKCLIFENVRNNFHFFSISSFLLLKTWEIETLENQKLNRKIKTKNVKQYYFFANDTKAYIHTFFFMKCSGTFEIFCVSFQEKQKSYTNMRKSCFFHLLLFSRVLHGITGFLTWTLELITNKSHFLNKANIWAEQTQKERVLGSICRANLFHGKDALTKW